MHQTVSCPKCGAPLTVGEKFCGNCGTGLRWPTPPPPPPQYPPPPPQYQQAPNYPYQSYQQPPGWGQPPPPPPPAWGPPPPQPPPAWGPPPQPPPYGAPPFQQPYGYSGYYGAPRKSGSSGLTWMVAIIAILVLAAGGLGVATNGTFDFKSITSSKTPTSTNQPASTPTTTPTTPPPAPSGLTVSADELITAYKTDKTAADAKYKGKTVTVTGKLESYNLSTFTVNIKGDTVIDYSISCAFNKNDSDAINNLQPEQSLKIVGIVGDLVSGEIQLKNCSFIK